MKKKKVKSKLLRNMNKPLLIMCILYSIIGVLMILSASSISAVLTYGLSSSFHFFRNQLINLFIGFIGFIIILKVPTKHYKKISSILMMLCILVVLYSFAKGTIVNKGISTVTFDILGKSFQPAEFIKVIMVMFLGSYYYSWINKSHGKYSYIYPILVCLILIAFIALGGDFGSAAIMLVLVALIFASIPTKNVSFKVCKCVALVGMVFAVLILKYTYLVVPQEVLESDNRLNRLVYKNPCSRYLSNSGYQVCNGYIAINNGGLFGVGIGKSTQKYLYLPASHTDFIFAIVIEELGALVGVLLIIGYAYIIYLMFKISKSCYNLQNSVICYGIAIYFMLHVLVNLSGVLGVLPLTGVPLPFLSYGGSFTLSFIASIAVVQRIHIEMRNEKIKV